MAFKLSLVSDVRSWLKGTEDVEKSLDHLADALDGLAADTEADASKAADALKREFTDAFDKVKTEAKTTSRKMGDDINAGTRHATQGVQDFKQEAHSSLRETAASFSNVADAADLVQEVAANAFVGFGPAGIAAGLAAAGGIGLLTTGLQEAKAEEERVRRGAIDMGRAFAEAKDQATGIKDALNDALTEDASKKGLLAGADIDRVTLYQKAVEQWGVSQHDVMAAAAGDLEALKRLQPDGKFLLDGSATLGKQFIEDVRQQGEAVRTATKWGQDYTAWKQADAAVTGQQITVQQGAAQQTRQLAGATEELTDAQKAAGDASKVFSDALTDNLSVADEGLKEFTHKGELHLREWAKELKHRAAENKHLQEFAVTIAPKLTPEALAAFEQLPTETQQQIAKAYKKGGKGAKKLVVQNLEAEAKVTSFTLDTSAAKGSTVKVPAVVDATEVPAQVKAASDAGQSEANKRPNAIEIKTRIDRDELQRQVDRAAAGIHPPTITIKTKIGKEQP